MAMDVLSNSNAEMFARHCEHCYWHFKVVIVNIAIVNIVINIVRWVLAKPYGSKVASNRKPDHADQQKTPN